MAPDTKDSKRGRRSNIRRHSLLSTILTLFAQPGVMTYLTLKSELDRVRALTQRPVTHFQADYVGQKILLLALYQKGTLRPDTVRLLQAAKAAGLYVFAVNTLKLKDPQAISSVVDYYVERANYGRDFGSYKHGFLRLFAKGWQQSCPRLLMMNDSVFCSAETLPNFLSQMMESPVEVLGSTENFEINYHLGSFCIALAGSILQARRFGAYWRRYRLSDVRPVVIRRGEMGLSRALQRCVSSPSQFKALYNSTQFSALLKAANDENLDRIVGLSRHGDLTPAKRFRFPDQLADVTAEYTVDAFENSELTIDSVSMDELARTRIYVDSFSKLKRAIADSIRHGNSTDLSAIRQTVLSNLLNNFRQHSQIHQNAAILVMMGLPIVKLDGVFRGMFDMSDVAKIIGLLQGDEAQELEELLMLRPFGGDVLIGWKRAAFMRGLI